MEMGLNVPAEYTMGFRYPNLGRQGVSRGDPLKDVPAICVCGETFSVTHAMCCPTGGFPTIRHNEVRDLVADLLTEVRCARVYWLSLRLLLSLVKCSEQPARMLRMTQELT